MKSGPHTPWKSSLFWRIYSTVLITVFAGTAIGAVATWVILHQRSEAWVGRALETLEDNNDDLVGQLDDPESLSKSTAELADELGTKISVYGRGGHLLAGKGPHRPPRRAKHHSKALRKGRPLVLDRGHGRQLVLFPLLDSETGHSVAVVAVRPLEFPRGLPMIISLGAMLALLGLGARSLSRSLTSRLGRLEASADRIANGELSHRVETPQGVPTDELDELAVSFNEMADKVEALIQGQRVLLANVSHELRTPISRVKVVLEILEERTAALATHQTGGDKHLDRLRKGLTDIGRDTGEIERLISDLLTSGRLELSAAGGNLELSNVDLLGLAERMAERFDARVHAEGPVRVEADQLLLERLLSNLLSNARRAGPDGALTIEICASEDGSTIAVEDEGYGIAPEDRDRVFEPFRRLDEARSRDEGGVGLGLYLCRQIARAHGGEVVALGRKDGQPGARLQVTLPKTPPSAG